MSHVVNRHCAHILALGRCGVYRGEKSQELGHVCTTQVWKHRDSVSFRIAAFVTGLLSSSLRWFRVRQRCPPVPCTMAGFTSETGNYLSICLYVQIVLLVLGGRYINDGTTLAVALGLTAVHGAMLELLNTFVMLSAVLLVVDVYVFIFGGLAAMSGWLVFLLVLVVISRIGCVWFGCAIACSLVQHESWMFTRRAYQQPLKHDHSSADPLSCPRLSASIQPVRFSGSPSFMSQHRAALQTAGRVAVLLQLRVWQQAMQYIL